MFDFFLLGLSLAPLGLLLFFWRVFPKDRGIHPIYRESETETAGKRGEVQGTTPRILHAGMVQRKGKVFAKDERAVAEKLGKLFGTGWPEKEQGKVIPFPNLSQIQEQPAVARQQAVTIQ